jgi:hypothetical protein
VPYTLLFEVHGNIFSTLKLTLQRFDFPIFVFQSLACLFEQLVAVGDALNPQNISEPIWNGE